MTIDEHIEFNVMKRKLKEAEAEIKRLKQERDNEIRSECRRIDRAYRKLSYVCEKTGFNFRDIPRDI